MVNNKNRCFGNNPVEIKASQTMNDNFFETLTWFQNQLNNSGKAVVVYGGSQNQNRSKGKVVVWKGLENLSKVFRASIER